MVSYHFVILSLLICLISLQGSTGVWLFCCSLLAPAALVPGIGARKVVVVVYTGSLFDILTSQLPGPCQLVHASTPIPLPRSLARLQLSERLVGCVTASPSLLVACLGKCWPSAHRDGAGRASHAPASHLSYFSLYLFIFFFFLLFLFLFMFVFSILFVFHMFYPSIISF